MQQPSKWAVADAADAAAVAIQILAAKTRYILYVV